MQAKLFIALSILAQVAGRSSARTFGKIWQVLPTHRRHLRQDLPEDLARISGGLSVGLNEDGLDWEEDASGVVIVPLILPTGEEVTFELVRSHVMHPVLQAKFPQIRTYTGHSVGFARELLADIDYSPEAGLKAFIRDEDDVYFIDPFHRETGEYKAYSSIAVLEREPWACSTHSTEATGSGAQHVHDAVSNAHADAEDDTDESALGTVQNAKAKRYRLTIALVANGHYSLFHGNKKASVLAAMVTVMNRVNGIYKRELGMFFQMHADTDALICTHPCTELSNTGSILTQMRNYIENRGVPFASYDLGHSFTTASGGVAYLSSMCSSWKAGGTTGLSRPQSDVFYVDYVAHEIGHQLGAGHTFTNCNGYMDTTRSSPVEPGSGTTIMGYAGICGSTDVQPSTDPMFHSKSIEDILSYVSRKVGFFGCGRIEEDGSIPDVQMFSTCKLPANSFFQLAMDKPSVGNFYTIEPVNEATSRPGYTDRSISRFRAWQPTRRSFRTFPNMYYIIHGMAGSVFDEIVPSKTETITFRGMARTLYARDLQDGDDKDSKGYGAVEYVDAKVDFDKGIQKLEITSRALQLVSGSEARITWSVGGTARLAPKVKIMIAEHDPAMNKTKTFNYAENVADMSWRLLAEAPNTGSYSMTVPELGGDEGVRTVHLMVRSPDDGCFFFDLVPFVEFHNQVIAPTRPPTLSPEEALSKLCASKTKKSKCPKQCTWNAVARRCEAPQSTTPDEDGSPSVSPTATPTLAPTLAPTTRMQGYEYELAFCSAFSDRKICLGHRDSRKKRRCKFDRKAGTCNTVLKRPPTAEECQAQTKKNNCNRAGCSFDNRSKRCSRRP